MNKTLRNHIERATVRVAGSAKGQGVLVGGSFIITVAHCVRLPETAPLSQVNALILSITIAGRGQSIVRPLAMEPFTDLAVLGAVDSAMYQDTGRFEVFCEKAPSVKVCKCTRRREERFPIEVFTHSGRWVKGRAEHVGDYLQRLSIDFDESIGSGSSGGPIVNMAGELVGVLSECSDAGKEKPKGECPFVWNALPTWACHHIAGYEEFIESR